MEIVLLLGGALVIQAALMFRGAVILWAQSECASAALICLGATSTILLAMLVTGASQ